MGETVGGRVVTAATGGEEEGEEEEGGKKGVFKHKSVSSNQVWPDRCLPGNWVSQAKWPRSALS